MATFNRQEMFAAIVAHPWQPAMKVYIETVFKPLLAKQGQMGAREFNHQLHAAINILKKEKKPPRGLSKLLKDIKEQNKVFAAELKLTEQDLKEVKTRIKKPVKFDGKNGYETYAAFRSMLRDIQAMRQILQKRRHFLKDKAYHTNTSNLVAWDTVENELLRYWESNKHDLAKGGNESFKGLQNFLLETQKNSLASSGDAFFKNFIKNRMGKITKAKEFTVLAKINFDERREKLEQAINKMLMKCDELGAPFNDDNGFKKLINDLKDNYLSLIQRSEPAYNALLKVDHADRDYKALYSLDAAFKKANGLINVLGKNLGAESQTPKNVITVNLRKEIDTYLKSFPKNPNENIHTDANFYNNALAFANFIKAGKLLPKPPPSAEVEEALVSHFIDSIPVSIEKPKLQYQELPPEQEEPPAKEMPQRMPRPLPVPPARKASVLPQPPVPPRMMKGDPRFFSQTMKTQPKPAVSESAPSEINKANEAAKPEVDSLLRERLQQRRDASHLDDDWDPKLKK